MEVRRIPSSELTHHGKDGQKWGVMHGPPYPLDRNASVQAKKKKKSLMTKIKDKRKGKQLQKARAQKREERAEREKIINSGDPNQIKKIADKLSDAEMEKALKKLDFNATINSYIANENKYAVEKGKRYIETASSTLQTLSNMATTASNVYTTLEKFGVVNKKTKTHSEKLFDQLKQDSEISKLKFDTKAYDKKLSILNGNDQDKIDKLLGVAKKEDKEKKKDSGD